MRGTEESSLEVDSSVPLTHHDSKDLGFICLVKKRKIHFRILSDFRIQSWIFLKKRNLNLWKKKKKKTSLFTHVNQVKFACERVRCESSFDMF